MNLKAARVSSNQVFEQTVIPFKEIPNQSPLFLDFLDDARSPSKFYPEQKTSLLDFSETVLKNYRTDRNELCDALAEINGSFGAGEKTLQNIKLLRDADCTAIVTGQQAGLFSGSVYTVYKALSAVKFAETLKKENLKTVPVFWIAEEDHDFEEIKKTYFLDKTGNLSKSENEPLKLVENSPVGFIKLDETIKKTLDELLVNLPQTEFTDEIKRLLTETYQPGETFSTAFAKLITQIFADTGLIILPPLNARLKKLCTPIFIEAIEKSARITSCLLERNEEIQNGGYQPQVLVEKDSFPFFRQNEDGQRQSLRRNLENGKIKIQKSKNEIEIAELIEIAQNSPQDLSPNALMRSVAQDYLLPTLTYFGGAAEIAYFAQNSVIYEVLNRPVTPIRHRASLTIVEPRNTRTLGKYELNFNDLFKGKDKIKARIVEKFLNEKTGRVFDEVEESIAANLTALESELTKSELTLAANLENRREKILWHLAALRNKYHRAEMLKNEVVERRLDNLFISLLPHNALQERSLTAINFLNLYGDNFIGWLYEAIDSNEKNHQILYL